MRISSNLRRSRAGASGSIPFVPVQVAILAATAFLLAIGGLSLALVSHAKSHSPAPAFLSAALGERSSSASSRRTAATRTFATMKTSVVRRGVRVTAPWAHAELFSLDAGNRPWTPFAGGAARTTAFGAETITLGGITAEEFLTVKRRQGVHTWRWSLDSSSRPRVTPDGSVEFLDAHGRPVLMHIAAPTILDRNGTRLAAGPLHWQVTSTHGRDLLTLRLDDTKLPVPYTIDPAITLTGSGYTVVKGAGNKTGTFALNVPAGTQTGDLLVVQFILRAGTPVTTPAGWTLLASTVDSADSLSQWMYTHIATASDTAGSTVFSVTTPNGTDAAGGIVAVRNVDVSPTNPAQVASSAMQNNGTATTSITTDPFVGSNNDYVMAFYGGMGQMGFTETNASMSPVWTASSENQMASKGDGSYTPSNSNVSSGSSGASRADSLVTAGSFGAGTLVAPSATLSTSGPWIMNVLAFRVALPWNQTLPTISGTVAVGQTLTAASGTWSNTPTGYAYQWQRCDAAGANCVAIAGATGSTYALTSADSGSTITVQVTASNANGTGQTVTSAQTAVVPASDGSGTLTSATSTVTAGSTANTIAFTYTAAGPISSGKVRLTVPAGWTAPSLTGSNGGYTTASTGTVAVAGQVVTVSNVTLATGGTLTITYGSRASAGPGATAPTAAGAQTWSGASAATSGGTITALAASPSITVNPAAANKVVWTTQPSNATSGSAISPAPAASIEDTYGNVVTSSSATVTAAIGTNPGGGTLSGTTGVAAVNGVATFSNLSINKSGTGYTLTAASAGVTSATSSAFNVTAGAASKLAFVQGPTNVAAGSSISPSVTVAVEDAAGNTVATSSAAVTVAVGTNPSGGTLSGTTVVNAVNGIATFSTLSLDKAGTGYTLSGSSGALAGATSGTFNVTAGSASKLVFVQGPTTATAGAAISPSVTVAVTDALGNTVTSSSAAVTLAIGTNPGGGTLSGTKTVNASSGIAAFSTLSIDKAGTGYTLAASATGLTGATSSTFDINVAAVSSTQSTVSASPVSLTANGVASSTITVTAKDAFGNPVSGQTVTLGQGAGSSTITTVSGTTSSAGAATFTVKDTKAETVTYSATVGVTGVLQTAPVTFVPGPVTAAQSTVAASPTSVTADGSTTSTITVTLKDANANPVAGKTVTLAKSGGTSTITTLTGTTDSSGHATFTVKDTTAEATTYTATDTTDTLTVTQQATVTFTAGPATAAQSTVTASPTSITADGSTTSTVTVTLKDANANPVAGKTVTLAKSGGTSTITTLTGTTDSSGHATFTVKDTTAETTTYTATDTTDTLTVTQQATVTFTAGAVSAGQSTVTAAPPAVTADGTSSSTVTVTLKDATGNPVAGKSVALAGAPGGSSISPASVTTNASGQATFTVSSTSAGAVDYTATDTTDTVTVTQKATVTYNAGAVSSTQSTVSASPASLTANGVASSTITVTAKDAFGNPVSGQTVTLGQSAGSSAITTVTGTTTAAGVATFTVTDTTAETVSYSATIGAVGVLTPASVTFDAGAVTAAQSTVAASPGSVTADGSTTSTVTVTLKDAHSNPVAGKTVTLANGADSSAITTVSGTTDTSGRASFTVTDTVAEAAVYTATDTTDGVTVTQQATVTFTPGAATHFTVSAPGSATAGAGFGVTVTALDANGNVATGYSGTVHLTSSDPAAALPADASAASGVATFAGVTLKTSGSRTVSAADGGITGTSGSIAVDAAAATSFTVSAPVSATAGADFGVTVTAHDAYGNVATGYTGTVHLGSSDARAALPADVAATAGVASFAGVTLKTAGASTVTASDGPLAGTSGSIAVSAGAASTFTVSAPASATAGAGFAVTATAYDAYGNLADGYTGTVSLTSGDGAAVLPGDATATAGVATFSGVQLRTAGTQSLTAADGAVTGSANVSVGAASAASFDVSAPGSATAGSGFSVSVTARDAYGNLADGYTGSVHLTSSDGAAALPADTSATGGVATFTGVTLKTSGTQSVTAADGAVTGTSGSIDVGAAAAATLSVTGASTATAGVSTPLTVTAHDAYGNVATGYAGAHPVTFSGASASPSPVTTPTVTDDSGSAVDFGSATELTFTNGVSTAGGSATFFAAENATIGASAAGVSAGGTLAVSVSAGAFAKFAFALSGAQVNGAAFTGVDSLTAEDAYGNVDTGFDAFGDHVTVSANGALTGAVSGLSGGNQLSAAADFTNGVAELGGLLTYTGVAGSGTFTATAATGETAVSGSVTIAAGAAAGFVVTGSATQTAGQPQTLGVRAVDASGNTATSYTGDHDLTFSGASTLGSFTPAVAGTSFGTPTTLSFANGAATGSLVLYKAESATIAATDGSLATAPGDQLAVDVSPDAVSTLELAATTTSPVAGTADALTLTARDAFGNVATGYTGDKSLTFGGATTAGSFAPTVTGTSGTPVAFGSATTIRFANGVSSLGGSMKLYTAETATVTVTDGSHGNGSGTAFAVTAAAPSALAVASVNGGSNPTAGIGFPVVVQAVDDYGNRSGVSAATGFSLSAAAGTGTLGGTTTGSFAAGQSQATVTGVTYTKSESGVRIGAARTSGDSLASGTSASFTVASSADRLVVSSVNGGSPPTAGQPFSVTVQAQDGLGNTSSVVSDTTVTISLAVGSGSLAGTVTATIPAGQSQATVGGLTYTVAESGVQLRATASGGDSLLAATSSAFAVAPGAADHLSLAGSGTETAGTPDALTITAYDAYGNVATGYTGDHSLTFSGASTIGSSTPTATSKDGSAVDFGSATTVTFAGGVSTAGASLVLYRAETAHVTAADGGIATSTPLAVDVSAASAASLSVSAPATSVAGSTFTATSTALDAYGNTDTSFGGTVSLGTGDSAAASAGVATFTGVRVDTAGAQTLTASAGSLTGAASVTVTPAAATHFSVDAPASATAGTGFGVTVTALDPYGNTDTNFAGTVQLAGDSSTAASGVATFASVTLTTAGVRTVTAQDGSLTGEATVVVGAAPASHFSVSAPASTTAGSAFGVTVTALDAYGNTDTNYAGTVQLAGGSAAAANGVADFAAVTLTTAGAQTITAQDGSLTGTASVDVEPAAATHFTVSAPADTVAGAGFAATVTALDAYGNTDTNFTGTVDLAGDSASATGGVASFTGVQLTTAGVRTITAQDGSLTGDATVSVTAAAATHFTVSAPVSVTAGSGFGVTVTALDAYGNTDTSYGGTVQLAGNSAAAAGGTASFAGVELTTAGVQTLTAQDGSLTGGTSITVDPASATHFSVSAPASAVAGTGFAVTVKALDAYGNTATDYSGTVQLAGNSATAAGGAASFTGVELTTAGVRTITAQDGSLTGSASVTVAPAAAASLVVTTSAASATAGDPLDVTVTAKDAYGNLATGYRGTVALTSGDSRATLAAAHAFGSGDAGSYTFTGGVAFGTAGSQTVGAGDATISGTSAPVSVSAGAPAALAFSGQPSDGSAGSALAPAVTVQVVDAFGNATASSTAVSIALAGSTGATLAGTLTRTAVSGVATFGDLSLDKAGSGYQLDASASGLAGATSSAFAIGAGAPAAAQSTLAVAPTSVTADGSSAATVTVQAHDAFGNVVRTGGATVALTTTLGVLSAVTDHHDGTYTAELTSTSAGGATVSGTLGGSALANTGSATFNAGSAPSASRSSIAAAPASLTAGSPSTLTVQARDAFGNDLSAGGATVVLSTDLGTIGTVVDNGDGTYTATLDSTTAGVAHVSGTLNGSAIGTGASVTFAPGAADAAHSSATAAPSSLTAGSTSTITVHVRDVYGNTLATGGDDVRLSTDLGTLGTVTDNGDGTYTASLDSTTAGAAHVTGTVDGSALTGTTVAFGAAAANAGNSTLAASPASPTAGSPATVTVTLVDAYGNRLASGGDDVRISSDLGTVGAVTDNGDGTYTATLTSTGTGTAHVTGTVNGAALAGTTVSFEPGAADAGRSTLAAAPLSLVAGSASSLTVSLADAYGNALTAGGDDVRLSSDLGVVGAVTDNHDGTYTATLSSTTAGSAHVTGTVNGAALAGVTVHYAVGAADAATSTVSAAPLSLAAGATSTVTVRLEDANGNALTTGGDDVRLSTDLGTLGTVTDNGDGSYTASLRSTATGDAHVSGTVDGSALTGATVSFGPAAADAAQSSLAAAPASLAAGASSTVTVRLKDAFGNPLTAGGDDVRLATDLGTLGTVTDDHDGTYTATLTSTAAGTAHVTGTVNGAALTATTVAFAPAAADGTTSTLSAAPSSLAAGGSANLTVRLRDAYGNALSAGGDDVVFSSDHGTLGTIVDNGDGTYGATLTATAAGDAHVTATVNGEAIAGTTVAFGPAAASAAQSTLSVSSGSTTAGTPVTVTVSLRDAYGNALVAGGDTVTLDSDLGTVGAVTDNGDGTYTASLDSSATGTAHVTGTVDGAALAGASVDFVPGAASATTSTLGVAPATSGVDSAVTVTVRLRDANGNALPLGGDDVRLSTDLGTLGTVTDNGDGTYTATLTSTVTGAAHVTGTVNGASLTGSTATFTAGSADAATSTLDAAPTPLAAGATATVTVRLKDSHGNALTVGGDDVQLSTDLGTLGAVTDNHDGTYTASLRSTATGTAHVTGTVNGAALAGAAVSFTPGAADGAHSDVSAAPPAATAGGSTTLTVRLADAFGNALAAGGDDVRLTSDLGTVGPVTDNGDGTYTATLDSNATGTAHVAGTVNGNALTGTTVSFVPGAVSAGTSTVTAGGASVSTDGAGTTVTVVVEDAQGNRIPNAHVTLAPAGGSSTIDPILGADTDTSGVATFTVADTTAETVVYSATAAGTLLTPTATVQYVPGAASAAQSSLAASPAGIAAGGSSTVTVRLRDAHGNALVSGGDTVAVASDSGTVGAVTDHGDGTYTATLTATQAGTAHVTATVGGVALPGTASVAVGPAAADAAQSTITASPAKINADGTSGDATITVQLRDAYGNALRTGGASVALASSLGALSSVTDNGDGTYAARLSANGGPAGTAQVTGTLGGTAIGDTADVVLAPPVPTAVVDSAPTGTIASGSASISFHSGNDPGATFECKLDGGSYAACTSPQAYSGLADGTHTFTVRGVNVNGPGTGVSASWTSDTTAPDATLTRAPSAYTNAATEPLAASASDATSGVASVDFVFAPAATACASGTLISTVTTAPYATTWTLPADGKYVVCAVAHDAAGNVSTAATSDVVVDTTKPTITFPSLGTVVGSDRWIHGSVDLHTTSFDQTSGVASVGFAYAGAQSGTIGTLAGAGTGGTTDSYDQGWDTTTVADGAYTVTATATDEAANADDATQTLNVDNTAPTASLDDPGAFGHGTIPLSVTASDTGSGVNTAATLVQSSPHGADTWTTIADPATWTPADGDYDLRAVVTDNVGNQTITTLRTILVDNTPPTVTSDADSAWHASDVTVTLTAVDDESGVATVEYKLDSGSWTSGTSIVVPATVDGVHTVTYHATNRAGVTSADATATVKIDHTPPSNVTLDAPAAGALLRGTLDTTELAGTAQDATSGIASTTFRIAPAGALGANPCNTFGKAIAAPFDTTTVADGSYDMWNVAVDAAGNGRCSVVPHTVTIDNTPPSTTDDAPFGARNADVTVHLTATDATSGVASTEYSVDGGAWTSGDTVTVAAAGHEGTNTIRYYSTDNAGNVEPTKTATVVIDTTAPAGTATDPNSVLRGTVQLTASPTDADIASVEWLYRPVGGSSWTEIGTDTDSPWELPWITTGLPDGAYELEAISTDSTGNETTQLFSTKTVDNTAPDSATMTAPNANADLHGTIAFSSSATDATSGIDTSRTAYQVKTSADSDFQTVSGDHWDSTAAPDGPAEVRVAVWDRAGNGPLYSPSVTFTVDNSAPTVQLSAPAATNGDAALGATGSADIASVQYAYRPHGGGSWTTIASAGAPFGATWSTNGLPEGEYDVQATATDGGGNTGTAIGTVLVDRTAPTVSLTAPAAGTTVGGSAVTLSGSASDAASGVDTVVYRYRPHGSGSFTTISGSTWDVSGLASGDYDVQALVTDHAGNTSTDTHTVTVDSTPPSVSAFAVSSPQHGTVALHVTADATAAKVTYGITPAGGTSWSQVAASTSAPSFDGSFDSTTVADGAYDFRAIVADSLGNTTTVDVPNVTIDNTAPSIVSSTPADGAVVSAVDSITATASEPVASVSSLELDGLAATFTPSESGNDVTFPTGALLPGNHALTGDLLDAAGNSLPFRINLTVNAAGGASPVTSKNTSDGGPTTLASADGGTLVTVPAHVWRRAVPKPHDWLVLKVNPSPAPWEIPASGGTLPGSVVDVRLFWDLAGTEEHQFDAPIEVDLIDPSGADGTPATAEAGASWRAIPELDQAGTLPPGQPDGYWRTGATVHVLTRHLSLFTVLVGAPAGTQPSTPALSPVPPPIDFSGVFATDGLTLRWAPGMDSSQLSNYTLYADGVSLGVFGPTTYEAKLGPVSADDARRFTIVEQSSDGVTSGPSPALRVMPAVAGLTVQQATAALAARHLVAGRLVSVPSTAPAGTVVGPTDLALLVEGSTVDLQVSNGVVARSPFAFSVATAPTVSVGKGGLVARVGLTTRARVDVTIDAYPYVRIHRWHFFHVPAGTKILHLRLGSTLKPGQYRLFWKATAEADRTVQRTITPLRTKQNATAPKNAAIVVISNGRSAESAGGGLFQASVEQAFLYATFHEVRGFVVEPGAFDATTVRQLLAVYPHRAVVVLTGSSSVANEAKRAGASTLPASATRRQIAALVAKLDR